MSIKIGVGVAFLLLACTILVWSVVFERRERNNITVSFLDVGQGDAVLIETQQGTRVLIDGGKGRAVLRALGKSMSFFERDIDVVIATHPDLDHIGGLADVFDRYAVGMFIEPGVQDEGEDNTHVHSLVKKEGLNIVYARSGQYLLLDDEVTLEFLFPDRDVTFLEVNTASIVAKLTYKNTSFLFTGDSPTGIESYLVSRYGDLLDSDVLKLGHHGSNTSSSDIFLGYVTPEFAVVSAGCENPYGHPHKEVLEKLERFETTMYDTCTHGTIVFSSDGTRVTVR